MSRIQIIVSLAVLLIANGALVLFAFLRYRATRDLPPTLPQRVEPPVDVLRASESARLGELEREFQNIQRSFNDLHTTVETRHRSLTGFIAKKMGRARALPDDDDEPDEREVPKSAFEKLAELEQQQRGAPVEQQPTAPNGRRHLRRY